MVAIGRGEARLSFTLGGAMQDFRKLDVWTKAHELAVQCFRLTQQRPDTAFPGLVSQMRRAASSIPANIAEGCGHTSQAELARFLQHSIASAMELEYHLLLARDLELIPLSAYAKLDARNTQVRQMLIGLLKRVREQRKPLPRQASRLGATRS
jgi:four helix bundle protein